MEKDVQKLIDAGQQEDSVIVHAAPGEMVVPPVISEQTQQMINQDMQSVGLNPAEYMIGQGSVNNLTGLQEFGFLSKLFKKVKKVVKKVGKKVLPVAGALLIPGVGGALGKGLSAVGSKLGIKAGLGSKILGGSGVLDTAAKVRSGIAGLTGLSGGQQPAQQTIDQGDTLTSIAAANNVSVEELLKANPMIKDPNVIVAGDTIAIPGINVARETGPLNMPFGPILRKTFLGEDSQPIFGQQIGTQQSKGLGLGGAGGIAALAALYGLATKKAAEKTEGGLRDVRLSTRPDLLPQATFQELDMRMGGPSVGPGTETSDDIPAMLSDGEFVMTAAANKGLGGFKIEKNKDSLTIFPTGKPDREQGFKNNDKLMKFFEGYQDMMS
jgi:LysM repeat protein